MSGETLFSSQEPSQFAHSKRKSLSEILAGRAGKQRRKVENEHGLQEAAIQLLGGHQNLSDLLLEVEDLPSKEPCSFPNEATYRRTESRGVATESLVGEK
nr:PREDICTED: Fanconi anemia group A protein-like [Latimeria chalumnae]|eukprot:XP_014345823.1 PREDICTED: Fanconi anemia group A protein-like [Latimeria chalumnae]